MGIMFVFYCDFFGGNNDCSFYFGRFIPVFICRTVCNRVGAWKCFRGDIINSYNMIVGFSIGVIYNRYSCIMIYITIG